MLSNLIIEKENSSRSFSSEILIQSLSAIGMEIDSCVEFVDYFRKMLLQKDINHITVQDLELLVEEHLRQKSLDLYAQRYKKFLQIKDSGKPIVIFIAGATGCGKSTLATELAYRFKINRLLSTDVVRSIMRAMISQALMPSLHKSSFEAWRVHPFPFSDKVDPVLASFVDQATRISVAVEAMIDRVVKENLNLIMEGVHLLPGIYQKYFTSNELKFIHIVLGVEDENQHRERFVKRGIKAQNRPGQRYLDNFESIRKIQTYVLEESVKHNLKIFYDTSFKNMANAVMSYILDGV